MLMKKILTLIFTFLMGSLASAQPADKFVLSNSQYHTGGVTEGKGLFKSKKILFIRSKPLSPELFDFLTVGVTRAKWWPKYHNDGGVWLSEGNEDIYPDIILSKEEWRLASQIPNVIHRAVLVQTIDVTDYSGKTIEISAQVKTSNSSYYSKIMYEQHEMEIEADLFAFLHCNVAEDPLGMKGFEFINDSGLVLGNSNWQERKLFVDIVPECDALSVGGSMIGLGEILIGDLKIRELVEKSTPSKSRKRQLILGATLFPEELESMLIRFVNEQRNHKNKALIFN